MGMEIIRQSVFELPMEIGDVNRCGTTAFLMGQGDGEKFEIFNLGLKTGHSLKIKGKISDDTDNFSINLGCKSSDLAFHFNPRFNESVIVCNSKHSNAWEAEHRDHHLCFSRGSTIKIVIEMLEDKFQVRLPDGHEVEFPNRHSYNRISYMSVKGGFRVTSFKLD